MYCTKLWNSLIKSNLLFAKVASLALFEEFSLFFRGPKTHLKCHFTYLCKCYLILKRLFVFLIFRFISRDLSIFAEMFRTQLLYELYLKFISAIYYWSFRFFKFILWGLRFHGYKIFNESKNQLWIFIFRVWSIRFAFAVILLLLCIFIAYLYSLLLYLWAILLNSLKLLFILKVLTIKLQSKITKNQFLILKMWLYLSMNWLQVIINFVWLLMFFLIVLGYYFLLLKFEFAFKDLIFYPYHW